MTSSTLLLLVWAAVASYTAVDCRVSLRHLSTVYLPKFYDGRKETYEFDADAVKRMAFDSRRHYLYVVGGRLVQVIDYSTPEYLHRTTHYTIKKYPGACSDVTTCGDKVAVSFIQESQKDGPKQGKVFVFKAHQGSGELTVDKEIDVGPDPTNLQYTNNCTQLVVTIAGKVVQDGDTVVDPEGGVYFITDQDNVPGYRTTSAGFDKFNQKAAEYVAKGVRWPWRGEIAGITTTFSASLEPSSLTMSVNTTTAYVTLQKNNAIATLDLVTGQFLELYPLGWKNWSDCTLDPSDKDGGANMSTWNISSLYQPADVIQFHVHGVEYLATADAGAETVYTHDDVGFSWSDAMRGSDLLKAELIGGTSTQLSENLTDDAKLGRLEFSTVDGLDPSGKIRDLVFFGGRGISVYRTSDMKRVYESKDLLEALSAEKYPEVYNIDTSIKNGTFQVGIDGTSSSKGPEPVSVAYAELGLEHNKTERVMFVGTKNPGSIYIFKVPSHVLKHGRGRLYYENMQYSGGIGAHWEELWRSRISRDLDPEHLLVLPADRSRAKEPILAVLGSVSGTISFYAIYEEGHHRSGMSTLAKAGLYLFFAIVLILIIGMVTFFLAELRRRKTLKKRADPERKNMVQMTEDAL